MSKFYSKSFYTNPFRYRKFDTKIDQLEIFDDVNQNLRPFLAERFSLIKDYIDELGNFKSELKVIKLLREKLINTSYIFNDKSHNISKKFIHSINNIDTYNTNLRYLELPLQPTIDNKGYEVQFLSHELIEDVIEEIDEGFSYVYDYCSQLFPESIDLWTEYAILTPNEFPFISHDYILESTYEIFDKIFDNLQKNSVNFFNWVLCGDLNTHLLKVIKPKIAQTKINYLFILLESLLTLTLFLLILKYILLRSKSIFILKNKTLKANNIRIVVSEMKKDLNFKTFRLKQFSKGIKSKILIFKNNCKYEIVKTIAGNIYI